MEKDATEVPTTILTDAEGDSKMEDVEKKDESRQVVDVDEDTKSDEEMAKVEAILIEESSDETSDDANEQAAKGDAHDAGSTKNEDDNKYDPELSEDSNSEEMEEDEQPMVVESSSENEGEPAVVKTGLRMPSVRSNDAIVVIDDDDTNGYPEPKVKTRIVTKNKKKRKRAVTIGQNGSGNKRKKTAIETLLSPRVQTQERTPMPSPELVVGDEKEHTEAMAWNVNDPEKPEESETNEPRPEEEPERDSVGIPLDDQMEGKADVEKATEEKDQDDKEGDKPQ